MSTSVEAEKNVPEGVMDQDEWERDYLPFRVSALIATVIAFISLLALVFPKLFVLPIIAIIVSLLALRGFGTPPRFSGLGVAKFALFMSVFSLVVSVGYHEGRKWYIHRTAYQHSQIVTECVMNGEFFKVWEYMKEPFIRWPKETDLSYVYSREFHQKEGKGGAKSPYVLLNAWTAIPPVSIIRRDNREGKMEFIGFKDYTRGEIDPHYEQVACDYLYTPAKKAISPSLFRIIFLRRDYGGNAGVQWRVRKMQVLEGESFSGVIEFKNDKFSEKEDEESGEAGN